ncbi:MAG: PLP-dependent aminotransferase family protein [Cyanobacteria bacterium RU_5_0]|nr:PLP-dependent aminotransferase family protein [Cyanobacteria bacterium RU_5_0]
MLWLSIDRTSDIPLIRQIYLELRRQILRGELSSGQRLPSSRELAAHLGVSRNVVLEAYDQLISEGYLESKSGSGTYVAQGAYWELTSDQGITVQPSDRSFIVTTADLIDFRSGIPALDHFPRKLWGELTKRVCLEASAAAFGYSTPEGCLELRSVLAQYLRRTRGVHCQPDQIVITSGAAQAFSLVGQLLLSAEDTIALENPTTPEIREIYSTLGAGLDLIPVDDRGIQTQWLPASKPPKFILVTPSHQFPLGSVLTIQRRIELLQYAKATGSYIVEDDYDSEFRYSGTPVSSLQGLSPESVIYIGSFSKILSPALRLGYLVLPLEMVQACRRLKRLIDLHSSTFEQLALAEFIQAGHLERHIARMKKLYRQRRDTLKQLLNEYFPEQVRISGDSTGLHLVAELNEIDFSPDRLHKIEQQRIRIYPMSIYAPSQEKYQKQIVMGFGNVAIEDIKLGIQRLKRGVME